MIRAALILCLLAGAALAQTAPQAVPEPPERPDPEERDVIPEADVERPMPDTSADATPVREALRESDRDYVACLADLNALGTAYEEQPPIIGDNPDCGIARPLLITEIVPGVALNPDSRMRCETARALGRWMETFVLPASAMIDRGPVTAVDHGSTYVCRSRASGEKLSEHAFGNAVDVMGFRFEDGSVIAIEPRERDGTLAEAFQDAVRASACLSFTTVLGPGTDAAHADHLHLDVKARNGGFRLCQ